MVTPGSGATVSVAGGALWVAEPGDENSHPDECRSAQGHGRHWTTRLSDSQVIPCTCSAKTLPIALGKRVFQMYWFCESGMRVARTTRLGGPIRRPARS